MLNHVESITHHKEVREVVDLLKAIRQHQDHPEMEAAFLEHDHKIAHAARDHEKDIMHLMVQDYIDHLHHYDQLGEAENEQLENHIKYVIITTLKGYQEVVEGIRAEMLQASLLTVEDLPRRAPSRSEILADIVHPQVEGLRKSDPRFNAAYLLMERIRELGTTDFLQSAKKQNLENPDEFTTFLLKVASDESDVDFERLLFRHSSMSIEFEAFGEHIEMLMSHYIELKKTADYKVRKGLLKVEDVKALEADCPMHKKALKNVPEDCHDLQFIVNSDQDVVGAVCELWVKGHSKTMKRLERIIEIVSTDAQCYIDSDAFLPPLPENFNIDVTEVSMSDLMGNQPKKD